MLNYLQKVYIIAILYAAILGSVAQWIARRSSNPKVAVSSTAVAIFFLTVLIFHISHPLC